MYACRQYKKQSVTVTASDNDQLPAGNHSGCNQIKTNIQSKILKTTIMILCNGASWIEVAIDKLLL